MILREKGYPVCVGIMVGAVTFLGWDTSIR